MTTSQKWLCLISLTVACLMSLGLSLAGAGAFLWGGLPHKNGVALWCTFLLPWLLAFPLFAIAAGISQRATLAIWLLAVLHFLAMTKISVPSAMTGPVPLLNLFWVSFHSTVPNLLLAALTQYGTQFYEFSHDSNWVRWKEAKHAPAN